MCLTIAKSKKEFYTAAVFNNKPFLSAKKQLEQFIRIQKTPKVVFKFFKITKEEKTEMHTPYRLTTVKMDGDLLTCNGFFSVEFTSFWHLAIKRGIHAYINEDFARTNYCFKEDIMLPCIIPANTPFVYGTHGEIASIQLFVPPVTKDLLPKNFHHLIT